MHPLRSLRLFVLAGLVLGLAPALAATSPDTATPTEVDSLTPTEVDSATPTQVASATPTEVDSPTVSPTITPVYSATASPTASPTLSASPTATPTGTPGSGSYSYSMVDQYGNQSTVAIRWGTPAMPGYNVLNIKFVSNDFWSNGVLVFSFPPGFDPPDATKNFVIMPAWDSSLWPNMVSTPAPTPVTPPGMPQPYSTPNATSNATGSSITVQVMGLYPGQVIAFQYGGLASGGFNYNGANLTETVQVFASPYDPSIIGGALPTPGPIPIWSPNATLTVTPTSTITPVLSPTPTITVDVTPTVTATYTITPVGPDLGKFYSYPNPFDLRRTTLCTFRFPAVSSASITIYNLLGEVVARVPQASIFPGGFAGYPTPVPIPSQPTVTVQAAPTGGGAIWLGTDDYGGTVSGGLYFAVLTTPSGKQTLKFTILH